MVKFIGVSVFSGFLFGTLDMVMNANPYAATLMSVFAPIARASVNAPLGLVIDLLYGFVMAWVFVLLYKSLPGKTGLAKGISYGVLAWFFRVVMSAASQYMMFTVSVELVIYTLLAGLLEMLVLGIVYGVTLKPTK